MRHYWLDRILELEPGARAVGIKGVALADDAFTEHFPGNPVLPGIYVLEGLAQTAGVLLDRTTDGRRIAVMASIERARFVGFARPGDQVRLAIEVESLQEDAARVMGSATADGRAVASARFTFTLVEPERLIPAVYHPFWRQAMAVWRGEYLCVKND
jgi:3-hydroxyacyl-[acyl-carrier-protein] dehydratase